jgi:type II secretory pathway component PulK
MNRLLHLEILPLHNGPKAPWNRPRSRRGVALLLTLWMSMVLALVAYSLLYDLRLDMKLTSLQRNDMKAFYAARAGVARGVVDLTNDAVIDLSKDAQNFDGLGDVWANQDDKIDVPMFKPKGGQPEPPSYSVNVTDEESKISLNHADYNLLYALLRELGQEDEKAKATAGAIIDWRDADTIPYTRMGKYESEYYAEKQMKDENARMREGQMTYVSKNDMFSTLDELLDVYGVTPELYYGHKSDQKPASRALRSVHLMVSSSHSARRAPSSRDKPGLRDFLTVWTMGSVNVNTAPREVLTAIAAANGVEQGAAEALADQVITQRGGDKGDYSATFRTMQEFGTRVHFPAVSRSPVNLTVNSQTFLITSVGKFGGVEHKARVLVRRQIDQYPLTVVATDQAGIWEKVDYTLPYYMKLRVNYRTPNQSYQPAVRVLQWIEW